MSKLGHKRRKTRKKLLRIIMDYYQVSYAVPERRLEIDGKISAERIFSLMGWNEMSCEEAKRIAICFAQGYIQSVAFGEVLKAFIILKSSFWTMVFSVQTKSDASRLKPKGCDGNLRMWAESGFRPHIFSPA